MQEMLGDGYDTYADLSAAAYVLADAMLLERAK